MVAKNFAQEASVCVCVCVCVRARVCVPTPEDINDHWT